MPRTYLFTFLALTLLLSACGGGATPAATQIPSPAAPEPTAAPTTAPAGETPAAETPTDEPEPAAGPALFVLDPARSQVSFSVDEVLRNSPYTAIGVTSQVSGEIQVDFENPPATVIGPITIVAGSLTTDSSSRNGMIQRFILDTNTFPTITFTPTSISGLPDAVEVGATYEVTIVGDLTIRDITATETFTGQVTLVSETELQGYFSTVVLRGTVYGLQIPSVPQVASVDDDVKLEISFVAVRQ